MKNVFENEITRQLSEDYNSMCYSYACFQQIQRGILKNIDEKTQNKLQKELDNLNKTNSTFNEMCCNIQSWQWTAYKEYSNNRLEQKKKYSEQEFYLKEIEQNINKLNQSPAWYLLHFFPHRLNNYGITKSDAINK